MSRSAFVSEEEVAVGDESAEVGQCRCFDVGEDVRVVAEFVLVAQCDVAFASGKVEDNLCIVSVDDASQKCLHDRCGQDLVFESCGGCCHDDGPCEVDAFLLHEVVIVLFSVWVDVEAECLRLVNGGNLCKGFEQHVVLFES